MSDDKLREQVSAYLDGELSESETDLLLKRFKTNRELLKTVNRFQLIKDTLSKHTPVKVDINFSQRLHERIASEPVYEDFRPEQPIANQVAIAGTRREWFKTVQGVALAASVAVIAIIGVRLAQSPNSSHRHYATLKTDFYSQGLGTKWAVKQREVGSRLNGLLVNHSEYTSGSNLKGIFNFVQIASYDTE